MRLLDRLTLKIRSAFWQASSPLPRLRDWSGAPTAGYYSNDSPETLRRRAEDSYRNSPVSRRAIDFLANSVIGSVGVSPQFSDTRTQQLWSRWCDSCDYDQRNDWTGLQHLVLSTVAVSGEAFVLLTIDPEAQAVPLSLRVLSPDFLDTSRTDNTTRG